MSTNAEMSESVRNYAAAHGARWREDTREWWMAYADALVDDELHDGGVCGERPCLLHDRLARHEDCVRGVYERDEAVNAYRRWKERAK